MRDFRFDLSCFTRDQIMPDHNAQAGPLFGRHINSSKAIMDEHIARVVRMCSTGIETLSLRSVTTLRLLGVYDMLPLTAPEADTSLKDARPILAAELLNLFRSSERLGRDHTPPAVAAAVFSWALNRRLSCRRDQTSFDRSAPRSRIDGVHASPARRRRQHIAPREMGRRCARTRPGRHR